MNLRLYHISLYGIHEGTFQVKGFLSTGYSDINAAILDAQNRFRAEYPGILLGKEAADDVTEFALAFAKEHTNVRE